MLVMPPRRTLWQPQRPRWVDPRRMMAALVMMSNGHLGKTGTGHLRRSPASGHLARCPNSPCGRCSAGTPSAYRAIFSGLTNCATTCTDYGSPGRFILNQDPNGTWDVPQDPSDPCHYLLTSTGITWTRYTTFDCSDAGTIGEAQISITLVSTDIDVTFGSVFFFGSDTVTDPFDCTATRTITNGNTGCTTPTHVLAAGGSVQMIAL